MLNNWNDENGGIWFPYRFFGADGLGEDLGGLFPLFGPEGLPVVLGPFGGRFGLLFFAMINIV